jgi:hypothetical protein
MFRATSSPQRQVAQIWSAAMDTPAFQTACLRSDPRLIRPVATPLRVDPAFALHPDMRVLSNLGRSLGRVDALGYDTTTGFLISLTVRHGLFGHARTSIDARQIEQITGDTVILRLSLDDFRDLRTTERR